MGIVHLTALATRGPAKLQTAFPVIGKVPEFVRQPRINDCVPPLFPPFIRAFHSLPFIVPPLKHVGENGATGSVARLLTETRCRANGPLKWKEGFF